MKYKARIRISIKYDNNDFTDGVVEDIHVEYNGFSKNDILNAVKGYRFSEAREKIGEKLSQYENKILGKDDYKEIDKPSKIEVDSGFKEIDKREEIKSFGGFGGFKYIEMEDKKPSYDDEDEEKKKLPHVYKVWKKLVTSLFKIGDI